MKRVLPYLFISVVLLTSCHRAIWDKLNDHESRIAKLEALCSQINTKISSLQSIVNVINARDYVKDMIPVMDSGNTIGYTITFNSHDPVTISKGKNGEDAHTPLIGIKKDDDGVWYWTLDGQWILDGSGGKVQADGDVIPRMKIEEDAWWVSYDNGTTWPGWARPSAPPAPPARTATPSSAKSARMSTPSIWSSLTVRRLPFPRGDCGGIMFRGVSPDRILYRVLCLLCALSW